MFIFKQHVGKSDVCSFYFILVMCVCVENQVEYALGQYCEESCETSIHVIPTKMSVKLIKSRTYVIRYQTVVYRNDNGGDNELRFRKCPAFHTHAQPTGNARSDHYTTASDEMHLVHKQANRVDLLLYFCRTILPSARIE